MGVKFFGQFLLEKNIITPSQLIEAVEFQEKKNLKFGEYAISKGYITEKDVEKFQQEQKHVDMLFGELAVKLNILTPDQVKEILAMQKNDHILIGEVLLKKGFITQDVLEKELALFKKDQSKYTAKDIRTPSDIINPEIVKDIVNLSQKMLERVADLHTKIGDGFVSTDEPKENFLLISISLYGNLIYEYALSTPQEISNLIASAMIGKNVNNDPKEVISEGVKEFCNVACGNIIAKLSQRGNNVDIKPPEEVVFSADGYNLVRGRPAIYYPIISPKGVSTLILIEGQ